MVEVPKVYAYYLPQFYAIPENDRAHGAGFTEWDKVRGAVPLFPGHQQPRVPAEPLGYYSLKSAESIREQAKLANEFGIDGFVFYHYWFHGTKLLEKPLELLLSNPDIDLPFALCWANEAWTKRWDGGKGEVIVEQRYSLDDAAHFINDLIPVFNDPRYISVFGRPILFVYRTTQIPGLSQIVDVWKDHAVRAGLPVPYLIAVDTDDVNYAREAGFDAVIERPLYRFHEELKGLNRVGDSNDENAEVPYVYNYEQVAELYSVGPGIQRSLPTIPSAVVSWDVSPRHGTKGLILDGRNPEAFGKWLRRSLERSEQRFPEGNRFVVVNAWNEWAEGAYLEPDSESGTAFLEAVREAKSSHHMRRMVTDVYPN